MVSLPGARHQTVLLGENVAKMKFRDSDGGAQMKGGATKGNGVFSTPLYEENVGSKTTSESNNKNASPRKERHQTMLMGEGVAKYEPRKLEGGKRGIMSGAVQNTVFSTPAYEAKAAVASQSKSDGKNTRHQTVLMAEKVAKYQSRDVDNKVPQMKSGAAKGVFSTPAYHEESPASNSKEGKRHQTVLMGENVAKMQFRPGGGKNMRTGGAKKNVKGLFSQYEYASSSRSTPQKRLIQKSVKGEAKFHSRKGRNTVLLGERLAGFQYRDGFKPNAPSSKSNQAGVDRPSDLKSCEVRLPKIASKGAKKHLEKLQRGARPTVDMSVGSALHKFKFREVAKGTAPMRF